MAGVTIDDLKRNLPLGEAGRRYGLWRVSGQRAAEGAASGPLGRLAVAVVQVDFGLGEDVPRLLYRAGGTSLEASASRWDAAAAMRQWVVA